MNIFHQIKEMFADHPYTNTLSVAAITSWKWLPSLDSVSTSAALWLPILGAGWIAVQTATHLWKFFFRK